MEEGSLSRSLDRIESAMARIEVATRERARLAPPLPAPADDDLEQRHAALKSAVAQALTRIDGLVASQSDEPEADDTPS